VQKKRTLRVFNILAMTAFALAVIAAGAVFALNRYADSQLAAARDALARASNPDDARRLAEIGAFDARLTLAEELLSNHLAPSRIFVALEELTKEPVQITEFLYEYAPGFEATLAFSVVTDELTSAALQRLEFAASPLFTEFIMSDIGIAAPTESETEAVTETSKQVQASFAGIIDADRIMYDPAQIERVPQAAQPPAALPPSSTPEEESEEVTQ
jgi:hypothetical protein